MSDPRVKKEKSKYKDFKQAPARDRLVDYHKKKKKKKIYTHAVVTEYNLKYKNLLDGSWNKRTMTFKDKYTSLELAERNLTKKQRERDGMQKHMNGKFVGFFSDFYIKELNEKGEIVD